MQSKLRLSVSVIEYCKKVELMVQLGTVKLQKNVERPRHLMVLSSIRDLSTETPKPIGCSRHLVRMILTRMFIQTLVLEVPNQ